MLCRIGSERRILYTLKLCQIVNVRNYADLAPTSKDRKRPGLSRRRGAGTSLHLKGWRIWGPFCGATFLQGPAGSKASGNVRPDN